MIGFWLIFTYFFIYYILEYLDKRKSPPGPLPIPILGNLIQLAKASNIPSLAFTKIAEQYGEIFQLRMGMKTMIIPSSVEAINTIFLNPETFGRDKTGSWHDRNFNRNLGIIFADGKIWKETRAWTIRNLRDHGFGKTQSMEASIKSELETFFEGIEKLRMKNKNIIPVENLFVISIVKIVWRMITGHYTTEDDVVISRLVNKSELALRKGVFGAGIVTAFPFVRFIAPESTGHAAFMSFYKDAHQAARELLQESKLKLAKRKEKILEAENLVEAFILKMQDEETKDGPTTTFSEENFIVIFMDLLQASSDPTSAYLEGVLLFMALYPDVQAKVYLEIQQFMPNENASALSERKKMIFTEATMMEIHRHNRTVQNLVPRRVLENFYYKNYLIKKGTILVANLHGAYTDSKYWKDPLEFRPDRFIGTDGKIIRGTDIMPFGLSKRRCPGESTGNVTSFMYIVSILKRYKLSTVPGKPIPRQDMHEGITSKPYPFDILFTERT